MHYNRQALKYPMVHIFSPLLALGLVLMPKVLSATVPPTRPVCEGHLANSNKVSSDTKLRFTKALENYDVPALISIARDNPKALSELNGLIQRALAEKSAKVDLNEFKPTRVVVGAGAATAMLAATIGQTMSESEKQSMLILEAHYTAVETFYNKDFILNSPTHSPQADANHIPHGLVQHTDLFQGRAPHSDETAFVLLTNLWLSKIPILFGARLESIESSKKGIVINIQDKDGELRTLKGILDLGLGTGPGKVKLPTVPTNQQKVRVMEALEESVGSEPLRTHGLYTTLNFLSAARLTAQSDTLIPHEIAIMGHAHSAYTTAEAIFRLWESQPHRFQQKPKILMIGENLHSGADFIEDVGFSSATYTKRELFESRYQEVLPKYFDDQSIVGIEGHIRTLEINPRTKQFSFHVHSRRGGNNRNFKSPLLMLSGGHQSNWREFLSDQVGWNELDAHGETIAPHSLTEPNGKPRVRPFARKLHMKGHRGQLWLFGNASPLLGDYMDGLMRNVLITGSAKSINAVGPQVEALGRVWSGTLKAKFVVPEAPIAPGSSLLNGF